MAKTNYLESWQNKLSRIIEKTSNRELDKKNQIMVKTNHNIEKILEK